MLEIIFPLHWTRSDRRHYSREQARKYACYGTPGQPYGRPAVYPKPSKLRPASTRSGQARVNYKRNQRAAFLEHLIALPVSVELADACDIERHLGMLPGRIIRREKSNYGLQYNYRMHVPDAPDGAATMEPLFQMHEDRSVTMSGIEWRRADGGHIGSTTAVEDDDDPIVQCWHYEPGSPCDWYICRQPERLAAGDRGTDPAERARQRTL